MIDNIIIYTSVIIYYNIIRCIIDNNNRTYNTSYNIIIDNNIVVHLLYHKIHNITCNITQILHVILITPLLF